MIDDIFVEKLIAKEKTLGTYILQNLIILAFVSFMLIITVTPFIVGYNIIYITGLVDFGLGYLCYRIIISFNKEYEYSLTNDQLSIDCIVAQRKRSPLFRGTVKEFTFCGRVNDPDFNENDKKEYLHVKCCPGKFNDATWYFVVKQSGVGMVFFFEPDERFLKAIFRFNPRCTSYRPGMVLAKANVYVPFDFGESIREAKGIHEEKKTENIEEPMMESESSSDTSTDSSSKE
ncbi:MAG TPA: hypothetical protein PK567_06255 [Bacillota bacterium]|nr:hypothetical protein [Bacillota bacterium]